jgi:hypothetical protein
MSCFISYGSPDEELALKLWDALSMEGVECWCHACDSTPTSKIWEEINEHMQATDRTLCICSASSIQRDGFAKEVLRQSQLSPEKLIVVQLDIEWATVELPRGSMHELARNALRERNALNFNRSEWHDSFSRLLTLFQKSGSARAEPTARVRRRGPENVRSYSPPAAGAQPRS